jgi:hypothetical protein
MVLTTFTINKSKQIYRNMSQHQYIATQINIDLRVRTRQKVIAGFLRSFAPVISWRAPEFLQPFFDPFFRQYSPVPILTGFLKRPRIGMSIKNQRPQLSKTGGSPRPLMSDCGNLV